MSRIVRPKSSNTAVEIEPQSRAKLSASLTHCDMIFWAISFRSECALETIAVVLTLKNWKTMETKPNTAVFGPSAASPMELTCPTHAVSTKLIKGSANTAPRAGSEKISTFENVSMPSFLLVAFSSVSVS